MRKVFKYSILLSILVILFSCFALNLKIVNADSISDSIVVTMKADKQSDNILKIRVVLEKNTALSGIVLNLNYDSDKMKLTNLERKQALSSLDFLTTNTETEKGYGITPFNISYSGDKNDYSTGTMFVLTFNVFDTTESGNYIISLNYNKNKDIVYIDNNEIKTKNMLIDSARVKVQGGKIDNVKIVNGNKNVNLGNIFLIAGIVLFSFTIVIVILLFVFSKKKKSWRRI